MGQAGSVPQGALPQRLRYSNSLPHDPVNLAPKVLPVLPQPGLLRSTDNGAILQSGGTISGRRPTAGIHLPSDAHQHPNVYRSRSTGECSELRARERDPLHRSHTNLDLRHNEGSNLNNRFGSEPDLRIEEEQHRSRGVSALTNKHFRKKYKAPAPPNNDHFEGSSPDSSDGNARHEPQRKLRLFKTRNESKKLSGHDQSVLRNGYNEYRSLDYNDSQFERRYRSPCKDKEQHLKYPDNNDMIQSTASLKREERLLQMKQDVKKSRTDRVSGCRAKTSKTNEYNEAWKTPLLNRDFRYSERFKRDESELPKLRREKTFNEIPTTNDRSKETYRVIEENGPKEIGEQIKGQLKSLTNTNKTLTKSLPTLIKNNAEKDEFQVELKKATSRIRTDLSNNNNINETKTSHNDKINKSNPTKVHSKVKESSLANRNTELKIANTRRPQSRTNGVKSKLVTQKNDVIKTIANQYKLNKVEGKPMTDRGQASGKESTPDHSPTREKDIVNITKQPLDKQKQAAPSKQFYFGMIESKQTESRDHLKDFPGLGGPIIEEYKDFHIIEQKLLGYHDEDAEIEEFKTKLNEDTKIVKNLSSESALSSDGSEGSCSARSLGIAVRLRPTLPKKQPTVARFSPVTAWRQLSSLDSHFAAETQPHSLAMDMKVAGDCADSSPRSERSEQADKSADSGISGDNAHSDRRIDSPSRNQATEAQPAWTPQQDLGDSSSDGAGVAVHLSPNSSAGIATYSPGSQPFSLSLPRDTQDRGKQFQQGFNSLQKFRKSVSGALGAALNSRRFDLEHEPMLQEPEQNWFLTKSAPNSLSNPLLYQQQRTNVSPGDDGVKDDDMTSPDKEPCSWQPGTSYLSWGGHVMYLPPPTPAHQPLSILGPIDRPVRSKSSGCLENAARAARLARVSEPAVEADETREMKERDRSASPAKARALPARVEPVSKRTTNAGGRAKRFTFQSTVRQLERRKLAEKLSKEADLKEQQRRTELEAMRRVEEEFQRKRAREKANIRQQLRLVSSGATSLPTTTHQIKTRDEPDGSCRESPALERPRDGRQRHSNASSEISGRSKSSTPIRSVELSEWRTEGGARVYRDWAQTTQALQATQSAHAHPPACARMPMSTHVVYNAEGPGEAFSGSPRSDNYRFEFARGRSPRTPRAPRLLPATRDHSTSGSELSLPQPIKIRETAKEAEEPAIVPTLRPSGPTRTVLAIR